MAGFTYFYTDSVVQYEIIKSQRGRPLLLIDGYTFSQSGLTQWLCSLKAPKCKAKLRYCNGVVTELNNEHTHPRRKYVKTKDVDFKFIKLIGNTVLLMIDGYTFARAKQTHWYCSKKLKGCKASVVIDKNQTILKYRNVHNHEPPEYKQLFSGLYVKIKG